MSKTCPWCNTTFTTTGAAAYCTSKGEAPDPLPVGTTWTYTFPSRPDGDMTSGRKVEYVIESDDVTAQEKRHVRRYLVVTRFVGSGALPDVRDTLLSDDVLKQIHGARDKARDIRQKGVRQKY